MFLKISILLTLVWLYVYAFSPHTRQFSNSGHLAWCPSVQFSPDSMPGEDSVRSHGLRTQSYKNPHPPALFWCQLQVQVVNMCFSELAMNQVCTTPSLGSVSLLEGHTNSEKQFTYKITSLLYYKRLWLRNSQVEEMHRSGDGGWVPGVLCFHSLSSMPPSQYLHKLKPLVQGFLWRLYYVSKND